ncbi:hypothetical protein BDR26DRAFT_871551 [Obelidium mucronatum]|nr:hypothetical protein BDR26DRAFT_871551 [Obelidium mucronatum]
MELYQVGKQCARPDCKQLDYLPYHCQLCASDYCAEHKDFKDHLGCSPPSSATPSKCPECHQPVNGTSIYRSEAENDEIVQMHIQNGCLTLQQEARIKKQAKRCAAQGCRKDYLVGCNGCKGMYCVAHRVRETHGCGTGIPNTLTTGGRTDIANIRRVGYEAQSQKLRA